MRVLVALAAAAGLAENEFELWCVEIGPAIWSRQQAQNYQQHFTAKNGLTHSVPSEVTLRSASNTFVQPAMVGLETTEGVTRIHT